MGKGADIEVAVLTLARVADVDGLVDAQENLDGTRQGIGGRDDVPRVDFAIWGLGQQLGAGLIV